MPTNTSPDPNRPPAAVHISGVRSALRDAAGSATELGDLLSAALAADDQQRRAVAGAAAPARRASDSGDSGDK
jgi:hypothetical protein